MSEQATNWDHVTGSIELIDEWTVIRLRADAGGKLWGQQVEVKTQRLVDHPGKFGDILDLMVLDIDRRLK